MSLIDETLLRQGRHNWYRNTIWSGEIEVAFLQKLRRARKEWHQYVAIQMNFLKQRYPEATLRLADYYLSRRSDDEDDFSYGNVMRSAASAYERMDQLDSAADAHLEAMKWQRHNPGHVIGVEKEFAAFAARHRLSDHYETILVALEPRLFGESGLGDGLFRECAVAAIFESEFGDIARAVRAADQALQCLQSDCGRDGDRSESGQDVPPSLIERLHAISVHVRPAEEYLH
ncbi:hypothetical protein [Jannaschia marina]|uniref:hypothetical protein n=1 Tax=Jannaschia marina TaxID=2741674 RepID=UPI0015C85A65|nr:hypothetical protein [Jannaschia marina]